MKSFKEMTWGDWYKLAMAVTSLALVMIGELLPESSGKWHSVLVHVGAFSAALHAALMKPEIALLFVRRTGKLVTFGAMGCLLLAVLAHAQGQPVVEAGTFHNCGLDGTAKRDDLKALNHLKNRATMPTTFASTTLEDFYQPGDDHDRFTSDVPMRVRGYVTGVKVGGVETVNCKATDPQWRDTHIELHRDLSSTDLPIIVEVSPRWRAAMAELGVDWSTAALKKLKGHLVEVEGWPLFDGEHASQSENTAPGGKANWRESAWEPAHPITALRVIQ